MFIEHLDALRCTSAHEESWLVASITQRDGRFITEGMLGCHICRRSFPVIGGVAYFGATKPQTPVAATAAAAANDSEDAMRIAAMLNSAERATVLLAGRWAALAHDLAALIPLRVFAMNPTSPVAESEAVAVILSSEGIPLASDSLDGVALDATVLTDVALADIVLASAAAVLRPTGRLVAPLDARVPAGVSLLVRDEHFWVGEKSGAFIPLRRAPFSGASL